MSSFDMMDDPEPHRTSQFVNPTRRRDISTNISPLGCSPLFSGRRRRSIRVSMVVRIRLSRLGCKNRPYYRVMAADSRCPRDGKFLEILGYYNPLPGQDGGKRMGLNFDRVKLTTFENSKGIIVKYRHHQHDNDERPVTSSSSHHCHRAPWSITIISYDTSGRMGAICIYRRFQPFIKLGVLLGECLSPSPPPLHSHHILPPPYPTFKASFRSRIFLAQLYGFGDLRVLEVWFFHSRSIFMTSLTVLPLVRTRALERTSSQQVTTGHDTGYPSVHSHQIPSSAYSLGQDFCHLRRCLQ